MHYAAFHLISEFQWVAVMVDVFMHNNAFHLLNEFHWIAINSQLDTEYLFSLQMLNKSSC